MLNMTVPRRGTEWNSNVLIVHGGKALGSVSRTESRRLNPCGFLRRGGEFSDVQCSQLPVSCHVIPFATLGFLPGKV